MSGFYIDVDKLKKIQDELNASHKQVAMAYNRALKRTMKKLYKDAVVSFINATSSKNNQEVKKQRVKYYFKKIGDKASLGDGGKIWIGLNDVPIGWVKGRISQPRARKRQRDEKGRFIKMSGSKGATFDPKAPDMATTSYPGAFITVFRGRKSIFTRVPGEPYLKEAKISIDKAVNNNMKTGDISNPGEILLEEFTKELTGIISRGFK
jgi:hypothetical protein